MLFIQKLKKTATMDEILSGVNQVLRDKKEFGNFSLATIPSVMQKFDMSYKQININYSDNAKLLTGATLLIGTELSDELRLPVIPAQGDFEKGFRTIFVMFHPDHPRKTELEYWFTQMKKFGEALIQELNQPS